MLIAALIGAWIVLAAAGAVAVGSVLAAADADLPRPPGVGTNHGSERGRFTYERRSGAAPER
jgi:hypothetical protein